MAFKEGDPKPEGSGRQKGTPNKRTFSAQKVAQELDVDPLEFLIYVLKNDWKALGFKSAYKTSKNGKKVTKTPHITFNMRMEAAKELLPYLYAKFKPLELNSDGGEAEAKVVTLAYNLEKK